MPPPRRFQQNRSHTTSSPRHSNFRDGSAANTTTPRSIKPSPNDAENDSVQHQLEYHGLADSSMPVVPPIHVSLFARIHAFELPTHVRKSPQDIRNLFAATFGPVTYVHIDDPLAGSATIWFESPDAADACLRRIIQHEIIEAVAVVDESQPVELNERRSTVAEGQILENADGNVVVNGERRKGFVYLAYYRIVVEGVVRLDPYVASRISSTGSNSEQRQGLQELPICDEATVATGDATDALLRSNDDDHSSSSSSSSDSDSDRSSADSGEEDEASATQNQTPNVADDKPLPSDQSATTGAAGKSCLVMLRVIEMPTSDNYNDNRSYREQRLNNSTSPLPTVPAETKLSGLLSPLVVYQMLRDVCLPIKIVLCKKQQQQQSSHHNQTRKWETRNVLVQVDKPESVAAVVAAFNGTVVELMEADVEALQEMSREAAPTATVIADPLMVVRVGTAPTQQQRVATIPTLKKATRVAARFRVLACESRNAGGRSNELNVPINIAGCLSVSQQTIMKMGGVFDRTWVAPLPADTTLNDEDKIQPHHATTVTHSSNGMSKATSSEQQSSRDTRNASRDKMESRDYRRRRSSSTPVRRDRDRSHRRSDSPRTSRYRGEDVDYRSSRNRHRHDDEFHRDRSNAPSRHNEEQNRRCPSDYTGRVAAEGSAAEINAAPRRGSKDDQEIGMPLVRVGSGAPIAINVVPAGSGITHSPRHTSSALSHTAMQRGAATGLSVAPSVVITPSVLSIVPAVGSGGVQQPSHHTASDATANVMSMPSIRIGNSNPLHSTPSLPMKHEDYLRLHPADLGAAPSPLSPSSMQCVQSNVVPRTDAAGRASNDQRDRHEERSRHQNSKEDFKSSLHSRDSGHRRSHENDSDYNRKRERDGDRRTEQRESNQRRGHHDTQPYRRPDHQPSHSNNSQSQDRPPSVTTATPHVVGAAIVPQQQQTRLLPPPPPPTSRMSPVSAWMWEAAYSEEYGRTYFIGTPPPTDTGAAPITAWELPMGAKLKGAASL